VKAIIETKGLTLHGISQKSAALFGQGSPYFLHHNFYYELSLGTFSPSLYQLFALSRISNYRLFDWLHVFGLDVEKIPRMEILLPRKRTALLDSTLNDPNAWVRWLRNKPGNIVFPIAPLSQVIELGAAIRQSKLRETNDANFLYAKIGTEDAFGFPDLLPGSIIRINPFGAEHREMTSKHLFFVEHANGNFCGRLVSGADHQVTLVSTHLPYIEIALRIPRHAKILGVVDLEIRRLNHHPEPIIPAEFTRRWKPEPIDRGSQKISHFLISARRKAGLSLREASQLTREVAELLKDDRYFVSPSSLSDYETADAVPKHFQKSISLCLSYSIRFRSFLEAIGLREEEAGTDAIPDQFIPRLEPDDAENSASEIEQRGFLGEFVSQMRDIPLFLRKSIDDLSGLPSTSLRGVFWVGGIRDPLHPYLANALLVSVDRHKKLPRDSRSLPLWEQSLYVVIKRDGKYLIGPCGMENGSLVMHPDAEHLNLREELRIHRDAEVIGQVCTVVRKL
jgi:hypothetical protein